MKYQVGDVFSWHGWSMTVTKDCDELSPLFTTRKFLFEGPTLEEAYRMNDDYDDLVSASKADNLESFLNNDDAVKAADSILREESKPWSGEGSPPVNTRCLMMDSDGVDKCGILMYLSDETAVFRFDDGHERCCFPNQVDFRPIKTPEEKEREEFVLDVMALLKQFNFTGGPYINFSRELYDLGYRKPE